MAKPNLLKFTPIQPPTIHHYQSYLPTSSDESLSILEKINRTIQFMEHISKQSTDVIHKWNEVMEWVMDEKLTEDVINVLHQMSQDGKLANIINNYLLGSRASIHVSKTEPSNLPYNDNTVFWYQDKGENPLEFNNGNMNGILKGVIMQDDEPDNTDHVWFDEED